ncbi:MAG: ABC transporter permease [Solirubrobacteraceae bacterium]|nr:MAG: peptide ABC transporter permease [Solirubrobacterales bacterium]
MARFAVRRLASMVAVMFAISILTFLLFQVLPNSDPSTRLAGRTASPTQIAKIRSDWGFDKPIYVQYIKTMGKILNGTVTSYQQQLPVEDQIRQDLPTTLSLAIGAGVIWLALGILFGVLSAWRAGRWLDRGLTVLSLVGVSMPVFFLGAVLSYYIGDKARILPAGDYVALTSDPWQWFKHMLMPWFALSVLFIGVYSRILRSTILDTINDDYVRTARAKGLSERQVMIRHVLRNSLIPIVSLWGLDFASVLGGGAILTETVFNLHGVGQYAAQSVEGLDIPPVLVITMFGAFAVVLLSAVVDIVYAALDPRIRL